MSNENPKIRYVCRFCAAGGSSDAENAPLFHNCHVCKAPNSMIPAPMHRELITMVVFQDVLMAKLDQIDALLKSSKEQGLKTLRLNAQAAVRVIRDQRALDKNYVGFTDEPEPVVNEAGEPVYFRTYLNRLIDRCPEAVQQHVWDLREQADPEEERYTREDLEDAYRAGFDFAQVRFEAISCTGFKTPPGWRRHTLQTGLGNFLRNLKGNTEADNSWGSDDE